MKRLIVLAAMAAICPAAMAATPWSGKKVVFLGELNKGPLASFREGFDVFINIGAKDPFSITYPDTMQKYFTYVLNYQVTVAEEWESDAVAQTDAAAALEPFPAMDCSAWIDGQLVFRLS